MLGFKYDIGIEPRLDPVEEDDRELLGYCEVCGQPIYEGDDFYLFEELGINVCESCACDARRCG